MAEVKCAPDTGADAHYDRRLTWSQQHHVLDYLTAVMEENINKDTHWVGLDNRNEAVEAVYETNLVDGSTVSVTDPIWKTDGNAGNTKLCASVPSPNGGFIQPTSCSSKKAYSCMSRPRYLPPDNPCPLGFFPHKTDCIMPVKTPALNYTDAQKHCAARGSYLYAAKDKGELDVIKEYAANYSKIKTVTIVFKDKLFALFLLLKVKGDVYMGVRAFRTTYGYSTYVGRTEDEKNDPILTVDTSDEEKSYADGTPYEDGTE